MKTYKAIQNLIVAFLGSLLLYYTLFCGLSSDQGSWPRALMIIFFFCVSQFVILGFLNQKNVIKELLETELERMFIFRYFKKADPNSPSGGVFSHYDSCKIYEKEHQCTCGLLHDLSLVKKENAMRIYPNFENDINLMNKKAAV